MRQLLLLDPGQHASEPHVSDDGHGRPARHRWWPALDNTDYIDNQFDTIKLQPFNWTTYPERLEAAGISWQIYQQGTGFDNFNGNYGTNMLATFQNFANAPAGSR